MSSNFRIRPASIDLKGNEYCRYLSLVIEIACSGTSSKRTTFVNATSHVEIVLARDRRRYYIGSPVLHHLICYPSDNEPTAPINAELRLEVSNRKLEAIETIRAGGDLALAIAGDASEVDSSGIPFLSSWAGPITLSKSDWSGQLEKVHFNESVLVELSLPAALKNDVFLSEAIKRIKKAHDRMCSGDWEGSVEECRKVLEAITEHRVDKEDVGNASFNNISKEGKVRRLQLLRKAAAKLLHPTHHVDTVTMNIVWEREDAVAAIAIVSALLKFYTRSSGSL